MSVAQPVVKTAVPAAKVDAVMPATSTFVEPKVSPARTSSAKVTVENIANWSIFPNGKDGDITARNNRTAEIFEGTVLEFNKKFIRGE